jgi:hypothetical protein
MLWIASFSTAANDKPITYEDHIAGIMKKHCATCHGDVKQKAGLSLVSYSGLMKGTGGVILPLSEHKKTVRSLSWRVAISGDGTIILAGDSAGQLHAWPTK